MKDRADARLADRANEEEATRLLGRGAFASNEKDADANEEEAKAMDGNAESAARKSAGAPGSSASAFASGLGGEVATLRAILAEAIASPADRADVFARAAEALDEKLAESPEKAAGTETDLLARAKTRTRTRDARAREGGRVGVG